MTSMSGDCDGAHVIGLNASILVVMRLVTVSLSYVVSGALGLNHFLYTLLKERYLKYQVAFYIVLFIGSLLTAPPRNRSPRRWRVLVLLSVAGYVSSLLAFFLEVLTRSGFVGLRSPALDATTVFFSGLASLGWLFGGLVGVAVVTLERQVAKFLT